MVWEKRNSVQVIESHLTFRNLLDKLGTTGRGIGPTYCEKANRSGIRVGDLKHFNAEKFKAKLTKIADSAHRRFNFEYDIDAEVAR